jgi:hypothetical protein
MSGFSGYAGRGIIPPEPSRWVFDGVDDAITFGTVHAFDRATPFSITAWINPLVASTFQICGNNEAFGSGFRGYVFDTLSTRRLWFGLYNTNTTNGINIQTIDNVIPLGGLVQVGVSYSGNSNASGALFYVNGATVAKSAPSQNNLSATTVSTQPLIMGGGASMRMQHVAIWSGVALTAAHMAEIYNGGTPPDLINLATTPDPALWVKLNASDTVGAAGIRDLGTGVHHGTALGGLSPLF